MTEPTTATVTKSTPVALGIVLVAVAGTWTIAQNSIRLGAEVEVFQRTVEQNRIATEQMEEGLRLQRQRIEQIHHSLELWAAELRADNPSLEVPNFRASR